VIPPEKVVVAELNFEKKAEVRQPKMEAEAVSQVTAPEAYVRPVEKVVVAMPVHVPPENARTCPLVPANSEVVEIAVGTAEAPVEFAMTVFAACAARDVRGSEPEMVESVEVAAAYTLPLASIASPPKVRLSRRKMEVEATLEMVRLVVLALERYEVEEAWSPIWNHGMVVVALVVVP
jgi:hypothetical protein